MTAPALPVVFANLTTGFWPASLWDQNFDALQNGAYFIDGSIPDSKLADSGVTAATYGDASHVAQLTVNRYGLLTSASSIAISIAVSAINNLGAGVGTFLTTPTSANLKAAVTDETGSGSLVFATSPTLVTPNLGTPSAITLTNGTGLPVATGISGLGTGVATFLSTPSSSNLRAAVTDETGSGSLVFGTSPTLVTPNLGTPSAVTLTNGTGLPISTGVSGLGTGVATFLGTPTSANLRAALTDETGTGALVFAGSPALTGTPTAPTAAAGTSTTQIATTAFANAAKVTQTFASVAAMLADTTMGYTTGATVYVQSGQQIFAGQYLYQIAASGAVDNQLVTSGGVKLYVLALNGVVAVPQFGTINGTSGNDTAIIDAANTFAQANAAVLYFPSAASRTYAYGGTGLTGVNIALVGDSPGWSVIALDAGKYLVDDNQQWGSFLMRGLRVTGGAGAIRNRFTGTNVQNRMQVIDCQLLQYTVCAVSINSSDSPDWQFVSNIIYPANDNTMGIALSGLVNGALFLNNEFRGGVAAVKLANGGNDAYFYGNAFLKFYASTGTGRHGIWLVPQSSGAANAGAGFHVGPNKFGNENAATDGTDIPIIFADEGTGTYFGDRLPDLTNASTGYVTGLQIEGATVYFNGATPNTPFIYTMTPNVYGCNLASIMTGGQLPTYLLQYHAAPSSAITTPAWWNKIGTVAYSQQSAGLTGFAFTNSWNTVKQSEPLRVMAQVFSQAASTTYYLGAGAPQTTTTAQWRFEHDVVVRKLEIYTCVGAVPTSGTVTCTALLNNSAFSPNIGVTLAAGAFGGNAYGAGFVGAANTLNVQITTNASAGTNTYLAVVEYDVVNF